MAVKTFIQRWNDIRNFDPEKDPAVAELAKAKNDAYRAREAARELLNKAERMRKGAAKDKALTEAQLLYDTAQAALEDANVAYNEAVAEPKLRQWNEIVLLHAALVEWFWVPQGKFVKFARAVGTGEMATRRYGGGEYEIHRFEYRNLADIDTFAVDAGKLRIRISSNSRDGALTYKVQGLDLTGEKLNGGTVPDERFGYEADVRFDIIGRDYTAWDVKVTWPGYSGMETLQDCKDMIEVHQTAVEFAEFLAETFKSVMAKKAE